MFIQVSLYYVSFDHDRSTLLDRVRKIYKKFPRISVPQHLDLGDDDEMQKLSEALGAAKVRVEGCSSFLKAAIKWGSLPSCFCCEVTILHREPSVRRLWREFQTPKK